MSAQNYCKSIGGNLPVVRQWEYLYLINDIAKPWPVYIGVTQVSLMSVRYGHMSMLYEYAQEQGTVEKTRLRGAREQGARDMYVICKEYVIFLI